MDFRNGTKSSNCRTDVRDCGCADLCCAASSVRPDLHGYPQLHRRARRSKPPSGFDDDNGGNRYGPRLRAVPVLAGYLRLRRKGVGWTFNPLYNFAGSSDGAGPLARVTIGGNGTLYGSLQREDRDHAASTVTPGAGTVFNLRPQARACTSALCPWTKTTLYTFAGSDGAAPQGDLTFDQSGDLFGGTLDGGSRGYGVVYELSPSGGSWTEAVLYDVKNSGDGAYAWGGVTFDKTGNIYGVFALNGPHGVGAIYELSPSGSGWTESTLYGFHKLCRWSAAGGRADHRFLWKPLRRSHQCWLWQRRYGLRVDPFRGRRAYSVLYSFTGCYECGPNAKLIMDAAGNLYGTTNADGSNGKGSVFKLTPVRRRPMDVCLAARLHRRQRRGRIQMGWYSTRMAISMARRMAVQAAASGWLRRRL